MSAYTSPSPQAQALVRGAFDLHVHVEPDVIPRRIDDLELARRFVERGLGGFVLKSHYFPTAERAAVVRRAVPGVEALGALVLNNAVGGFNPLAVELAARSGARFIWMPTVDAANEAPSDQTRPEGGKLPLWARLQLELEEAGLTQAPLSVLEGGRLRPEVRQVLRVVARHNRVLATGHLGRDEIMALCEAAWEEGVRQVVVTHPDYPTQNLPLDDQRTLARQGAFLERCLAPAISGKVAWEGMLEAIRQTGVAHNFLSTDLGQPQNPPVEEGLALFADRLLQAGFTLEEVRALAVDNPRRLALGGDV